MIYQALGTLSRPMAAQQGQRVYFEQKFSPIHQAGYTKLLVE
jgi:hypothetical protein